MIPPSHLPGFPRWTGARVQYRTAPAEQPNTLALVVSVRLTRRARLWAAWRTARGEAIG